MSILPAATDAEIEKLFDDSAALFSAFNKVIPEGTSNGVVVDTLARMMARMVSQLPNEDGEDGVHLLMLTRFVQDVLEMADGWSEANAKLH